MNEHGRPICQRGHDIKLGPVSHGKAHSVDVRLRCPSGYKVTGITHLHPSGNPRLSKQDVATAHKFGLEHICVKPGTQGRLRCYRFKAGRR